MLFGGIHILGSCIASEIAQSLHSDCGIRDALRIIITALKKSLVIGLDLQALMRFNEKRPQQKIVNANLGTMN